MTTAHDINLDDAIASMTGQPLTRAEQLDALIAVGDGSPELAELLDHVCIQLDAIKEFIDALGPALEGFADMGEQLMGGGMMGMVSMLMGGGGDADVIDVEDQD